MCDSEKVVYLSEAVATNAATLHAIPRPNCKGVEPYPCRDEDGDIHWHIGHHSRADGDQCKAEYPFTKPRRNHPTTHCKSA